MKTEERQIQVWVNMQQPINMFRDEEEHFKAQTKALKTRICCGMYMYMYTFVLVHTVYLFVSNISYLTQSFLKHRS